MHRLLSAAMLEHVWSSRCGEDEEYPKKDVEDFVTQRKQFSTSFIEAYVGKSFTNTVKTIALPCSTIEQPTVPASSSARAVPTRRRARTRDSNATSPFRL